MAEKAAAQDRTASEKIGAFVESMRARSMPPEVVHQVARAFVDTFAVAVAARHEAASRIARDYVMASGEGGPSTLWGSGERNQPEDAALANAVMAHVLDYDDVTPWPQRGHPSSVLLPALLALGEAEDATGGQVATAYVVGYEVLMKIPQSMVCGHYGRGWHTTSTLGVISAAAACANLLGLDAEQAAAAVGIAVAHVAGVRRSFGTMCKSLQPGIAASAAIRCARLAAEGFTAPRDSMDGPLGLMEVYGKGEDLSGPFDSLGEEPLELSRTGLGVKKYPCCSGAHSAIQGILHLLREHPIPTSAIERVRVTVHPHGLASLIHKRPWRGLEGKFSMEYCVAAALLDGAVRLDSFTDAAVQRPEAQALLRKVDTFEEEGELALRHRALVQIELRGGERRTILVDSTRGSAELPLSRAELEAKLRDCVTFSRHEMNAEEFLSAVWDWQDRPVRSILEGIRAFRTTA